MLRAVSSSQLSSIADADFLKSMVFLFLVDLDRLLIGNQGYEQYEERERGYGRAFLAALNFALTSEKAKGELSHDFIHEIHLRSTRHLPHLSHEKKYDGVSKNFKVTPFLVPKAGESYIVPTATLDGLQEFVQRWFYNEKKPGHFLHLKPVDERKINYILSNCYGRVLMQGFRNDERVSAEIFNKGKHIPFIENLLEEGYKIVINASDDNLLNLHYRTIEESINEKMHEIFVRYRVAITKAETNDEKLNVIAEYIQRLNQLHPYEDGNIRLCYILMQRLLQEEGLPLTLLINPNRLDMFSVSELVELIKAGQNTYQQMLQGQVPQVIDPILGNHLLFKFAIQPFLLTGMEAEVDDFVNHIRGDKRLDMPAQTGTGVVSALILNSFFGADESNTKSPSLCREARHEIELGVASLRGA